MPIGNHSAHHVGIVYPGEWLLDREVLVVPTTRLTPGAISESLFELCTQLSVRRLLADEVFLQDHRHQQAGAVSEAQHVYIAYTVKVKPNCNTYITIYIYI